MNRISFAVKSALGLALLTPPGLVLAQAAGDGAIQEVVDHRHPRVHPGVDRSEA